MPGSYLTRAKDERLGQPNPWWFDSRGALQAPDPADSRGLYQKSAQKTKLNPDTPNLNPIPLAQP